MTSCLRVDGVLITDRGGRGVLVVIKQVHTVVKITEERVQLQTAALRGARFTCVRSVIKPIVPISLIVIAPSFLRVAALTQKKTKSHRSELIVVDSISASRRDCDAPSASS